ncbi:MAG: D-glycero-beta-D-manno-heptose 1-phosphate adenylyltransferase [Leptospira sp.]|nr:D-glycero-beta-D-manno-heptose 1-phosphate adenylyltransferase [Leptospira sp.]
MNTQLEQIKNKIISVGESGQRRESLRPKKIIFTNGCFDILHPGHVSYLSMAKDLGDILWIGLNSDSSVRKIKGEDRPVNSEQDRALILSSLVFVDLVTIFTEETPVELLSVIKPEIHVKGGDYIIENLPEYPVVKKNGGEVKILPFIKGNSTTSIINKIKSFS